jgi:uncharacterized protein YbaP (TraB family)
MNPLQLKRNAKLLGAVALLFSAAAFAPAQAPKTAAVQKKCLFWKAVSGANVVYLLGSIHLASNAVYPLPKPIDEAFAASKSMVVEVDINQIDPSSLTQYLSKGAYSDGDTLWNHLKPETTAKVKKFLKAQETPPEFIGAFKPWLAGVMLPLIPMMKAGANNDNGIDKHFLDLAKGKKKIEQAETADFQFKLLSSVPDSLGDVYVNYCIGETEKGKSDDLKLEKLWLSGDDVLLGEVMSQYPKELTSLMNALLRDRNPHMADVAEKYLKTGGGPCFFVVGAAHLVGPEGVVALLQKRGYTVSRVVPN